MLVFNTILCLRKETSLEKSERGLPQLEKSERGLPQLKKSERGLPQLENDIS